MGQYRPLFGSFRSFLIPTTISIIQIEKNVDGVLGIRTRGRMMEGADDTTELFIVNVILAVKMVLDILVNISVIADIIVPIQHVVQLNFLVVYVLG